jgi:hypothetical protein
LTVEPRLAAVEFLRQIDDDDVAAGAIAAVVDARVVVGVRVAAPRRRALDGNVQRLRLPDWPSLTRIARTVCSPHGVRS